MSITTTAVLRPRPQVQVRDAEQGLQRQLEHRVTLAWSLILFNVLAFATNLTILHIPPTIGQVLTQGALPLGVLAALAANPKVVVRPGFFLFLVSLLAIEAVLTCLNAQYLRGTAYRTFRLAEFAAALWLLSPYFGRRDLLLVRVHLKALTVVLATVLLGLLVAPGRAMVNGRLSGVLWPIPSTQVAHYAAITLGLVVVLWFSGLARGKITAVAVVFAGAILLLTHTRTALGALLAALAVAGLSLIVARARVRRLFAVIGGVAAVAAVGLSGFITSWLARGQGTQTLLGLSGRTNYWAQVLGEPRNKFEELFGFGLNNAQYNGHPIDSNWIVSYQEQGLFGVTICAVMLVFLFVMACYQPRGPQRAIALFIVTYCLVASFTEVGFTDASTYLLDLTVAASLLVPQLVRRARVTGPRSTST
jgi:hypothetical protein